MKRAPYHPVTARRDTRLREIELAAWRVFGASLAGIAFGAFWGFMTF